MSLDARLFLSINGLAGRSVAVDGVMVVASRFGPFLLLAGLVLAWLWPGDRAVREQRQRMCLVAALGVAGALVLNLAIGHVWPRPRPFVAHAARLLLPPDPHASFPSDHTTVAFGIATAVFLTYRRAGVAALLAAALVAFARVYTGEHYVSDVCAGACIGALAPVIARRLLPRLEPILTPMLRAARKAHLA